MAIEDRKEREKEQLKERILDAAFDLFKQGGTEGLSIRKIAQIIEYSPTTIYLYFKNKDELLFSLTERGFAKLVEYMRPAVEQSDPYQRLRLLGHAYIRFGIENPAYYDLMFVLEEPMRCLSDKFQNFEEWANGKQSFNHLYQSVQLIAPHVNLRPEEIMPVTMNLWANVHGLVTLVNRNRLIMIPSEHIQSLTEQCCEHILNRYIINPS